MYNPVTNAVAEILRTIPQQILTAVFGHEDHNDWRRVAPVSIDEMIKSKVIRPVVIKDCNLVGGRQTYISTEGIQGHQVDTQSMIFQIPIQATGGREITSVLSVSYLPHSAAMGTLGTSYGSVNPVTQSDVEATAQRVMDSHANVPHISSPTVELIGYNTVAIRDPMRSTTIYHIRCTIAHDENLSNIQPRSYRVFADACKLATQSYIYNRMYILMGQGMLEQGVALVEFKDYVDRFQDSEEKYQEFVKMKLQKVLFMNDNMAHQRFIQSMINPGI